MRYMVLVQPRFIVMRYLTRCNEIYGVDGSQGLELWVIWLLWVVWVWIGYGSCFKCYDVGSFPFLVYFFRAHLFALTKSHWTRLA